MIAFYAAVHYVSAFLWEKLRYAPRDHADRTKQVQTLADLTPIGVEYVRLLDLSYKVRYELQYRLSAAATQTALGDVNAIASHIVPLI